MQYEYRTFSECGLRWKNEDTLEIVEMPEQGRTLFILYDGMGGHRMGYLTSRTVVKAIKEDWLEVLLHSEKDIDILAERIKEHCNAHARDYYSAILVKVIEIPSDDTLYK